MTDSRLRVSNKAPGKSAHRSLNRNKHSDSGSTPRHTDGDGSGRGYHGVTELEFGALDRDRAITPADITSG